MKRCGKQSMLALAGLLTAGALSCAGATEAQGGNSLATSVPMRVAANTSETKQTPAAPPSRPLPTLKDRAQPRKELTPRAPAAVPPSTTLKRGTKQLFVPAGSVRTVDAAGNALIKLPDGRRIRVMKGGRVEVLGPGGKVIERGRFVAWKDKAGIRAGERMGIRAGKRAGIRAGERVGARVGARAGGRAGARYAPGGGGQHLIYR